MDYLVLAADYDGTLAQDGKVSDRTIESIKRWQATGRKFLIVTGRQLDDLQNVFPHWQICEGIVVENGALIYYPAINKEIALGEPPRAEFIEILLSEGVNPLSIGKVIVATDIEHIETVQNAIAQLNLPLQIILNKRAVMILPQGVDKVAGLRLMLKDLKIQPRQVVAIGDAENDLAFLSFCGLSVAVANALAQVKEQAEWVMGASRGDGVVEAIEQLMIKV
jgi:hydroxymethylpyrimidine pyrophosphatase-like HAD family hydrolase